MAMAMMKLISMMKIKDKKYQSHLPNPGELPPSLPLTLSLPLYLSTATELITPAVQQNYLPSRNKRYMYFSKYKK